MRRFLSGFTLVEVMVTVVVVAIIAMAALPAYQDSVRKARRSNAKVLLTTTAQLMERYYTENATYLNAKGDACGIALPISSETDPGSGTAYYTIAADGCVATASTFTLTAKPQGSQAKDTACGNFTLTNAGVKGAGSTSCW